MTVSSPPTLEQRVAQLEETTARLVAGSREPHRGGWRKVIGMFGDDERMKQVDEEGRL